MIVLAFFVLVVLWCAVIVLTDGINAMRLIAPRLSVITAISVIFLLLGALLGGLLDWLHMAVLMLFALVPVSMSIWFALLTMTFVHNRARLGQLLYPGKFPR